MVPPGHPRRLGGATPETAAVTELLANAVAALGGSERQRPDRDGRGRRARVRHRRAPRRAGRHRAPASRWPIWCPRSRGPSPPTSPLWCRPRPSRCNASSSTATCPRLADSLADALPRRPEFALLKGRGNYLCLNKIHNGSATEPEDRPQEELFEPMAATALGRDVQRLIAWSSTTDTGDRDELTPGVPDRSWAQVSVSARECIGVARCPFGTDCFAEKARDKAGHADVVVTNHALLAIDAIADAAVLPEHRAAGRRRGARTGRPGDRRGHRRVVGHRRWALRSRRVGRLIEPELAQRLEAATATFSSAIHDATPGRIDVPRRRDDHLPDRVARRRQQGPLGDRHRAERPEGGVGARRGGDGAAATSATPRHASCRRSSLPSPIARTWSGSTMRTERTRGATSKDREAQDRRPRGAAGGAAFGGRAVARQAV